MNRPEKVAVGVGANRRLAFAANHKPAVQEEIQKGKVDVLPPSLQTLLSTLHQEGHLNKCKHEPTPELLLLADHHGQGLVLLLPTQLL